MSKKSTFLALALCLVYLSASRADDTTSYSDRTNQLQSEITATLDSFFPYHGGNMHLPEGYSIQEWKDAESAYEQTIAHTNDPFELPLLYEKLAITQMVQKNYEIALQSFQKSISLVLDLDYDWYFEPSYQHRLYLDIAEMAKLQGNKRQVAEALLQSVTFSFYYYYSICPPKEYDIIMKEIYQQWLPKDKAFQRTFYEHYIMSYNPEKDYNIFLLFAKKLQKLYTNRDHSQRNYVNLQLCIYDTTLNQADKLQKIKEYNREIAKQKIFTFAGKSYDEINRHISPDCKTWNCDDEVIRKNIDTIEYETQINDSRYWLESMTMQLDSQLQQEGCLSESYRTKFFQSFHYTYSIIGCEVVLACLEQMNKWNIITEHDIQWINDSICIEEPMSTDYISNVDEYYWRRNEMMENRVYCLPYIYICGGTKEGCLKYYDLYLPLVARAYGENSITYYSALLREAYHLLETYRSRIDWNEITPIDSTLLDETILNAEPIRPIQLPIISDNLNKVLTKWNRTGSVTEKLYLYSELMGIGINTYDAAVLDTILKELQELNQDSTLSEETAERIQGITTQINMYRSIIRKDLPLFHEAIQLYQQQGWDVPYLIDDYFIQYQSLKAYK